MYRSSHVYAYDRVAIDTDPCLIRPGDSIRWLYIGLPNDRVDMTFQVSSQATF